MAQLKVDLSSLVDEAEPTHSRAKVRAAGRLAAVPLKRIRPNDVNPRKNFGGAEELVVLGQSIGRKQLQAIRAVTRSAYVELFPEYDDQVPADIDVVIVNGERRFRAAGVANLETLEVVIDDELADSRKAFLDAVITENVDRQNFDPIEEAQGIELLCAEFGSADAVASHYGRHKSWVSQRRSLLKLSPEVQDLVRVGTIPIRRARELASLPHDEQLTAWEEPAQVQKPPAAKEKSAAPRESAAVKPPKPKASAPTGEAIDWDSASAVADLLIGKLDRFRLEAVVRFLKVELEKP
jgi:ParB family chromosome partitioning protein